METETQQTASALPAKSEYEIMMEHDRKHGKRSQAIDIGAVHLRAALCTLKRGHHS
jgi:hypothetical protein